MTHRSITNENIDHCDVNIPPFSLVSEYVMISVGVPVKMSLFQAGHVEIVRAITEWCTILTINPNKQLTHTKITTHT